MASNQSVVRRPRLWSRRAARNDRPELDPPAVEAPSAPAAQVEDSRFRPSRLSPVDGRTASLSGALRRRGQAEGDGSRSLALRLADRALLAVEVCSALVVAWLVWQYIYTAYIDTAPHRVSPPRAGLPVGVATGTAVTPPTPLRTRIAEVAPPMMGAPEFAQTAGTTPTATPTPTVDPQLLLPVRLRIPVMFLDSPVQEVTVNMGEWQVSPMDVGHHVGTGNPGEPGNVVLAAHRDVNSALFRELDRLQPGDEVYVSNGLGEYRYIVTESFVVGPDRTEVMDPTNDKRVTLITCTPIGLGTQRLVVTAMLDETYGTGEGVANP